MLTIVVSDVLALILRLFESQRAMHPALSSKQAAVHAICRQFHVARLDVFGSAARGFDFDRDRSDFDFLVAFEPPQGDLSRFLDFQNALEGLLGRPVDLVDRETIEASRNYIRRHLILNGSEAVYAA